MTSLPHCSLVHTAGRWGGVKVLITPSLLPGCASWEVGAGNLCFHRAEFPLTHTVSWVRDTRNPVTGALALMCMFL